ncbi:MAG: methionyl-tRNA formyltransferase [Bryobacterales bacterium]|nr:methionyl-tRNA formyltransferase [Bryobacterales bacterium]
MRLLFMGTPRFAVPTLEACAAEGHEVAAVFTQPDRPKGRGGVLAQPPVKEAALRLGLPVHQPLRVRYPEVVEQIRSLAPRAVVVVGYGQIIPQSIIDIPPLGILNVHASLLPLYRGAAPVQWAVANGDPETGITIMRIDAGLDTGGILLQESTSIGAEETALELGARLAATGSALLVKALAGLDAGALQATPQDNARATLAPILKKEDGRIDWNLPAHAIYNRLRGFTPWPGAWTVFRGQTLHVLSARPSLEPSAAAPGTLLPVKNRLRVACGAGTVLEIAELQLEGRKRVAAAAFLNGQRLHENERLGDPAN